MVVGIGLLQLISKASLITGELEINSHPFARSRRPAKQSSPCRSDLTVYGVDPGDSWPPNVYSAPSDEANNRSEGRKQQYTQESLLAWIESEGKKKMRRSIAKRTAPVEHKESDDSDGDRTAEAPPD